MMPVPAEVLALIPPMPADFAPCFTERNGRFVWRGRVSVRTPGVVESVDCEFAVLATSRTGVLDLCRTAWNLQQLGLIGRGDLITWARRDRHAAVKPSPPKWTPPAA